MSRRFPLLILVAALLSVGLARGASAAATDTSAELQAMGMALAPQDDAALPALGMTTIGVGGFDAELRSSRLTQSAVSVRRRSQAASGGAAAVRLASRSGSHVADMAARLLRGGLDSSALGTPPPSSR